MRKHFCVIGDPIDHSLSPAIYTELFRRFDLTDMDYGRQRVTKDSLPEFIESLPERGIRGFNVTMPLKEAVLGFLSHIDPSVYHGVNTVAVHADGLHGWSTDAQGFRQSLTLHDRCYSGSDVVFIGCGGAAQALIHDALIQDARHVVIANRTPSKAADFSGDPRVETTALTEISQHLPHCDILINATPLGMTGCGTRFEVLDFLTQLPTGALVADLIYDPPETEFLQQARLLGHDTMNGLWMLIWQAFFAFEHFTGILPDMDDFEAVRAALKADHPTL